MDEGDDDMMTWTLPVQCSVGPLPTSASLCGKTGTSPQRRPVWRKHHRQETDTEHNITKVKTQMFPLPVAAEFKLRSDLSHVALKWQQSSTSTTLRAGTIVSLKDEVVNVGQRRSDTFQQQVQRLHRCWLLSRVLTTGAQRQTETYWEDYSPECYTRISGFKRQYRATKQCKNMNYSGK